MRFFYNHVAGQEHLAPNCTFRQKPRKLPTVLTQEEIWNIINATANLKHRLILMAIYSAGLRASEVIALKPEHIDSQRMLIKVTGKGGKERFTLLATKFLKELRPYYKTYRPKPFLFPSSYKHRTSLRYQSILEMYNKARKQAGIEKGGLFSVKWFVPCCGNIRMGTIVRLDKLKYPRTNFRDGPSAISF